ncbi:hypothetical protein FEP08_01794 [Burkholderia multivorans]|nr:hypothetical protein [Burkholderia multivorans]
MFSRPSRTQDGALRISRRMAGEHSLRRWARTGRPQAARPAATTWPPGHLATWRPGDRRSDR